MLATSGGWQPGGMAGLWGEGRGALKSGRSPPKLERCVHTVTASQPSARVGEGENTTSHYRLNT